MRAAVARVELQLTPRIRANSWVAGLDGQNAEAAFVRDKLSNVLDAGFLLLRYRLRWLARRGLARHRPSN